MIGGETSAGQNWKLGGPGRQCEQEDSYEAVVLRCLWKDTQGSGQTGHTAVWVRVGLTTPGQTAQERKGPSQSVKSRCGREKQKWAAGLSHGPRKVLY